VGGWKSAKIRRILDLCAMIFKKNMKATEKKHVVWMNLKIYFMIILTRDGNLRLKKFKHMGRKGGERTLMFTSF
jgi:hypothetical protein